MVKARKGGRSGSCGLWALARKGRGAEQRVGSNRGDGAGPERKPSAPRDARRVGSSVRSGCAGRAVWTPATRPLTGPSVHSTRSARRARGAAGGAAGAGRSRRGERSRWRPPGVTEVRPRERAGPKVRARPVLGSRRRGDPGFPATGPLLGGGPGGFEPQLEPHEALCSQREDGAAADISHE